MAAVRGGEYGRPATASGRHGEPTPSRTSVSAGAAAGDSDGNASLSRREVVTRLVEALANRVSPYSGDHMLQYCMRILGSMIRPSARPDMQAVGHSIQRELRAQGGDYRRFQDLHRRLGAFKLYRHKAETLQLLLALNETRHVEQAELELIEPLSGPLPTLPAYADAPAPPAASAGAPAHRSAAPPAVPSKGAAGAKARGEPAGAYHLSDDMSFELSEALLLRDLVFVFQGIDGTYVKYNAAVDMYTVVPGVGLPRPARRLVGRLCELGWVYRRLNGFLQRNASSESLGLVGQAMGYCIQDELTDYFRLLAVLEAQIQQSSDTDESGGQGGGAVAGGLTLRRLLVWTQDPLHRMRLLASLVESVQGLRGGALASAVHAHTAHGDSFVSTLYGRVLQRLCTPLFAMIQRWVVAGELADEHGEFFVVADPTVPDALLWQHKYHLKESMLPTFIGPELGRRILLIGKSINFIRHCCGDKEWVMDDAATVFAGGHLQFGQLQRLKDITKLAYDAANRRLVSIMFDKYNLLTHCRALKRYLLLGQGDFVQYLMTGLGSELDLPASRQYHHNLVAVMDSALRSSNAQFEAKEVIDRLDIKLMQASEGDEGWDVFALTYKVDTPVNAVLTPAALDRYLRIFNFLWRLKRVEYGLCNTWCRHMTSAHSLKRLPVFGHAFHRCHIVRAEMMHVVATIANCIMFEVLESSWEKLVSDLHQAQDMDALIEAHNTYLDTIFDKVMMGGRSVSLLAPLHQVFDDVLQFVRVQEQLYSAASSEVATQRRDEDMREARAAAGGWLRTAEDDAAMAAAEERMADLASGAVADVDVLQANFRDHMTTVLDILLQAESQHDELRHLRLQIDFNGFYHTEAKRRGAVSGCQANSSTGAGAGAGAGSAPAEGQRADDGRHRRDEGGDGATVSPPYASSERSRGSSGSSRRAEAGRTRSTHSSRSGRPHRHSRSSSASRRKQESGDGARGAAGGADSSRRSGPRVPRHRG